jgi:hypothetical protein
MRSVKFTLPEEIVEEVRRIADAEGRPPIDVLDALVLRGIEAWDPTQSLRERRPRRREPGAVLEFPKAASR